jgi:hypothetical protein
MIRGESEMEADEFRDLIRECPLLVRMNDGREYLVEKPEFVIVGDYTAGVLVRDNGVLRNAVITLMNITTVIPNVSTTGN